jgi:hypothetical protein
MHAWPASRRAGTARVHQHADHDASGEELGPGRQASSAVPPMEAMGREELSTAQLGQREHVLEVGGRRCERSDHRGMGRAARRSQQRGESDSRAELESPGIDVLVGHEVAGEMCEQTERERAAPRSRGGTSCGARRDVKRDDQVACASKTFPMPARERTTASRWPRWSPSAANANAPKNVIVRMVRAEASGSAGSSRRQRSSTSAVACKRVRSVDSILIFREGCRRIVVH